MPITDPKCPDCNGQLPLHDTSKVLTCPYCGNEVLLSQATRDRPAPVPNQPPQVVVRMPRGSRTRGHRVNPLLLVLPIVGVLVGVGVSIYFAVNSAKKATQTAQQNQRDFIKNQVRRHINTPRMAKLTRMARGRTMWGNANLMRTARVNGDDVDDILLLGQYKETNGSRLLYLFAYDGATLKRIYRAGPFGNTSTNMAAGRTNIAVAGSRVVITDYKATARILELSTGKELRAVGLTDRVTTLCANPKDPNQVWLAVSDKNNVSLNVTTATVVPMSKHPRWCPRYNRMGCRTIGGAAACMHSHKRRGRTKGFSASASFTMNGHAIALGTRHPGSRRPMVAAYAGTTGKPLWLRELVPDKTTSVKERPPQRSSVAGGRVVVDYQLSKDEYRMTALDAATGTPQWDVPLPTPALGIARYAIVASPTRIFVPNEGVISVFDAATGKRLGDAATPE